MFKQGFVKYFIGLFKDSFFYLLASFLYPFLNFIFLPIFTRYLSPEDFGIISMFNIFLAIIGIFVGLNVYGAINRVFFDKHFRFKEYVYNSLVILFFSSIFVFIIVYIFKTFFSKFFSIPQFWIIFIVFVSFFQFIMQTLLSILQAQKRAYIYSILQSLQGLTNIFLSLYFIIFLHFAWQGRVLGQVVSILLFGIISIFLLFKWITFRFNFSYVKHALSFSLPLIPHSLGAMLMLFTDRIIITNLLGLSQTGIYSVGLQIGGIIGLIATAFNKAYGPWLFSKLNNSDEKEKLYIVKFSYLFFAIIILFSIALAVLSPYIIKLLGKSFRTSSSLIFPIALGGAFHGMYYIVTNYIFYSYKTYLLTFISIFVGILNIFVTYIFVSKIGISGAAYSYCFVFFIYFIITWIFAMRVYKMPWNLKI